MGYATKRTVQKIIENPEICKHLKYKGGEKTLYRRLFRLVYALRGNELVLLKLEYKKSV